MTEILAKKHLLQQQMGLQIWPLSPHSYIDSKGTLICLSEKVPFLTKVCDGSINKGGMTRSSSLPTASPTEEPYVRWVHYTSHSSESLTDMPHGISWPSQLDIAGLAGEESVPFDVRNPDHCWWLMSYEMSVGRIAPITPTPRFVTDIISTPLPSEARPAVKIRVDIRETDTWQSFADDLVDSYSGYPPVDIQ